MNKKVLAVFGGFLFLLSSLPAAAMDALTAELERLRVRGQLLRAQRQTVKAQYESARAAYIQMQGELFRVDAKAARLEKRRKELWADCIRLLDRIKYLDTAIEEKVKSETEYLFTLKWLQEIANELPGVYTRRDQLRNEIANQQQKMNSLKADYQRIKNEYQRVEARYYALRQRLRTGGGHPPITVPTVPSPTSPGHRGPGPAPYY
jgi:chromosome segregation ATPase